ncbi:MAG: hypothetical protein E7004_03505 [Alphaproteobacteria bacterium]|nr:hypothetical protein [Alphaproteobacteria bacterium]
MTTITDTKFSDIYITSEDKKAYIADRRTLNALMEFEPDDLADFCKVVEEGFDGHNTGYSINYNGILYRVEKSFGVSGEQYCARKMPHAVPGLNVLGYPPELVDFLMTLRRANGLILCAGPTGAGKTTTISSLLKEYLQIEGGFAYTIEDPTEHPLNGVYHTPTGGLGVCRQTTPLHGKWGESLKSALRSHPKYILVGEILSPDCASEVLRAATSGHLVFSTIHANNVTDAINSVVKYAAAGDMSEELAYDLFSRGMLGVLHQNLVGKGIRRPDVSYLFANPDTSHGDQVRGIIKTGNLNLGTPIETQMTRLQKGIPLFPKGD